MDQQMNRIRIKKRRDAGEIASRRQEANTGEVVRNSVSFEKHSSSSTGRRFADRGRRDKTFWRSMIDLDDQPHGQS